MYKINNRLKQTIAIAKLKWIFAAVKYLNKETMTLQLHNLFTCVVAILNQNYNINILNLMYLAIFFLFIHC